MPSRARTFDELLADVAAATPAPGGGSAAGGPARWRSALVEMTARFTLGRSDLADRHERMAKIAEQAVELRGRAGELAERELHAYEPVLEALRLPTERPGPAGAPGHGAQPRQPRRRSRSRASPARWRPWRSRPRAMARSTCAATP